MSPLPFLGRLAARAGAPSITDPTLSLRPDPWRGRDVPASDSIPSLSPDVPAPMPRAPHTTPIRDLVAPPLRAAVPAESIVAPVAPRFARADTTATHSAPTLDPVPDDPPDLGRLERPLHASTVRTVPPAEPRPAPVPRRLDPDASVPARVDAPSIAVTTPRPRPAPLIEPAPRLLPFSAPPVTGESREEPAPIEITIGRIELRAAPPSPPARATAPARPGPAGFAAYAELRAGIDRGRR
jgi:Meckel syndrome type 1 protein